MVPFIVLVLSFVILRGVGFAGVEALNNVDLPLRIALFLMFLLGASAHWGRGRPDLVRMVPPRFRHPEFLVTLTGVLEILGAFGLLVPVTSRLAALGLSILLLALFPANVRAAREHLTILGRPAPGLLVRALIQLVFIFALLAVALHERLHPLAQALTPGLPAVLSINKLTIVNLCCILALTLGSIPGLAHLECNGRSENNSETAPRNRARPAEWLGHTLP